MSLVLVLVLVLVLGCGHTQKKKTEIVDPTLPACGTIPAGAIAGRVASRPGTCAEYECPKNECCGCAFEAVLVPDGKPNDAIALVGGKCEQRPDCSIVCTPLVGSHVVVTGKLLRTTPDVAMEMTNVCRP